MKALSTRSRSSTPSTEPDKRLESGRSSCGSCCDGSSTSCNAIEYAHSRGVLHRDLKPSNIIVGTHGETLVVDWGLAKAMGAAESSGDVTEEQPLMPRAAGGATETLPGLALGTPAFMSPEQAAGDQDQIGPASDVYSLGATLYCLLTGQAPFERAGVADVLRAVQDGEFPPPREVDHTIPKPLEAVCLKAMAREPRDRYASPRELADDIERWMADEAVSARREPPAERARRWMRRKRTTVTAATAAALVALVGLAVVLAVQARANNELIGGQRARACPLRPRDGIDQDVSCRRQPGHSAQRAPVPGPARQAAARGARVLPQARGPAQGSARHPIAPGTCASLWRAGRADGPDRPQIRGARALRSRARLASRAFAQRSLRFRCDRRSRSLLARSWSPSIPDRPSYPCDDHILRGKDHSGRPESRAIGFAPAC